MEFWGSLSRAISSFNSLSFFLCLLLSLFIWTRAIILFLKTEILSRGIGGSSFGSVGGTVTGSGAREIGRPSSFLTESGRLASSFR